MLGGTGQPHPWEQRKKQPRPLARPEWTAVIVAEAFARFTVAIAKSLCYNRKNSQPYRQLDRLPADALWERNREGKPRIQRKAKRLPVLAAFTKRER